MTPTESLTALVISMDTDFERYERLVGQLSRRGIGISKIGGLKARYLPRLVAESIGGKDFASGTLGCFLSHVRAWEAVESEPQATYLILEDDAEVANIDRAVVEDFLASPFDVLFCNDRLSPIFPKQEIGEMSGEGRPLMSLAGALVTRPDNQIAPGGDGYILKPEAASRLKAVVASSGMKGDVDWFLVYSCLSAEERRSIPTDKLIRKKLTEVHKRYGETLGLRGAVAVKPFVKHASSRSSRLLENKR